MDEKLDSLRVRNFRAFEDLYLPELGQVNLIVGKNNSGKTCLLEAIRVYAEDADPWLLSRLVHDRHEDLSALVSDDYYTRNTVDIAWNDELRNLFHGYRFPENFDEAIEIGSADTSIGIRLAVAAYMRYHSDEGGWTQERLPISRMIEVPEEAILSLDRHFRPGNGEEVSRGIRLGGRNRGLSRRNIGMESHARFVAASGWDEDHLVEQWGRVSIRPKQREQVLSALRLIDPDIREVVMVSTPNKKTLEPIVVYDENRRIPLRGLGDGASRLFQMMLAAVVSRTGFVLFDEFENGLHWSVQPLAWDLIFKVAKEANLQVFATTHSWDCVRAFQEINEKNEATGMLFHLGKSIRTSEKGRIIATSYHGDALTRATRAGLEVR